MDSYKTDENDNLLLEDLSGKLGDKNLVAREDSLAPLNEKDAVDTTVQIADAAQTTKEVLLVADEIKSVEVADKHVEVAVQEDVAVSFGNSVETNEVDTQTTPPVVEENEVQTIVPPVVILPSEREQQFVRSIFKAMGVSYGYDVWFNWRRKGATADDLAFMPPEIIGVIAMVDSYRYL